MKHEEVQSLRVYHETRCEQEQWRIRNATCAKAALAHAHLFSLHRLMTIDGSVKPNAPASKQGRVGA